MKHRLLAATLMLALAVPACTTTGRESPGSITRGSGNVISETREISNITSLDFSGLGDIIVSQGSSESLVIEAEDNIMPLIKTSVRNGVLTIGFERQDWQNVIVPKKMVKFTLSVRELSSIGSSGLGNIQSEGLKADSLNVRLTGAGSVKLHSVDVASITTLVAGAGGIDLSGKAGEQAVTLSGLGSYKAGDLQSDSAKITVSGAGSATVWAQRTLNVTISGAGSVSYYGTPDVTKKILGVGSVKSIGVK